MVEVEYVGNTTQIIFNLSYLRDIFKALSESDSQNVDKFNKEAVSGFEEACNDINNIKDPKLRSIAFSLLIVVSDLLINMVCNINIFEASVVANHVYNLMRFGLGPECILFEKDTCKAIIPNTNVSTTVQ